jgi:hypothetical protein
MIAPAGGDRPLHRIVDVSIRARLKRDTQAISAERELREISIRAHAT